METTEQRTEQSREQPVTDIAQMPQQTPDAVYPQEEEVIAALRKRLYIRPELILGIVAVLAAALLVFTVVICSPYFQAPSEDPDLLPQRHNTTYEVRQSPTQPAEQENGTEPTTEPTIPPDPNPYGRLDFQYNRQNYLLLQNLPSSPGIDVSAFQGDIDWKQVKASGIEFAFIRLGYRGYGQAGTLVEDEYAQKNLEGATAVGMPIGAYFYSQALNIEEADEEIEFMLEILGDYELEFPIVLDWEIPGVESPRTRNMDARTLTDIQLHFCQVMTEKGYQPLIYFNWYQSSHLYYLHELEEYPFWLALYQDRMTYPWKVEMWQWTCTGRVPGISGDVDINVYMP